MGRRGDRGSGIFILGGEERGRVEVRTHCLQFGLTTPLCQRLAEPKCCTLYRIHRIPPREVLQMPCQVPRACGDVEKLGSLLLGGPHDAGSYQKKAEEKKKQKTFPIPPIHTSTHQYEHQIDHPRDNRQPPIKEKP